MCRVSVWYPSLHHTKTKKNASRTGGVAGLGGSRPIMSEGLLPTNKLAFRVADLTGFELARAVAAAEAAAHSTLDEWEKLLGPLHYDPMNKKPRSTDSPVVAPGSKTKALSGERQKQAPKIKSRPSPLTSPPTVSAPPVPVPPPVTPASGISFAGLAASAIASAAPSNAQRKKPIASDTPPAAPPSPPPAPRATPKPAAVRPRGGASVVSRMQPRSASSAAKSAADVFAPPADDFEPVEPKPPPRAPAASGGGNGVSVGSGGSAPSVSSFILPISERLGQIRSVLAGWDDGDTGGSQKPCVAAMPPGELGTAGATASRAALASKALAARAAKRAAATEAAEEDEHEAPAKKKAPAVRKVPRAAPTASMAFSWD